MKKLQLIAAILITAFIFSCSGNKKDLIVGKWKNKDEDSTFFEYKKDGTYIYTIGGETEEGTYRVDGSKLYTDEEKEPTELTTLDSDDLVLTMGGLIEWKFERVK